MFNLTHTPIPQVAYKGRDGSPYRLLIPVKTLTLTCAEGFAAGVSNTFHGPTAFLKANSKLSDNIRFLPTDGNYIKYDFTIIWANGHSYSGRYDLKHNDSLPNLADHVANAICFTLNLNPRPAYITDDLVETYKATLKHYDLMQQAIPASPEMDIVHDFSTNTEPKDVWDIQSDVFQSLLN